MIQKMLQENPSSKRPLSGPKLRLEDGIWEDFPNTRRENYGDRDWEDAVIWQVGLKGHKKKKKKLFLRY